MRGPKNQKKKKNRLFSLEKEKSQLEKDEGYFRGTYFKTPQDQGDFQCTFEDYVARRPTTILCSPTLSTKILLCLRFKAAAGNKPKAAKITYIYIYIYIMSCTNILNVQCFCIKLY
jgi:hypothetical protein